MKHTLPHSLFTLLCLLMLLPLSAQQHRDRWDFEDYFPKHYFYDEKDDWRYDDAVGEVVFYMRLANITPLRNITPKEDETIVRLNYTPKFAHPLFIQVQQKGNHFLLTWQKGKAIKGYVTHTTHTEMSDKGLVDITENKYYGNEWDKGVIDSGSRQLTFAEWQAIQNILTDIDFIHYPHGILCKGFQTPFILEYKDNRNSISYYTECPDNNKEERVTKLLVSLVDTNYVDMVVNTVNDRNGIIAPTYPGGEEACTAFIQNAIHYPSDALRDMEEYRARVEILVEKDGSISMVKDESWPKSDYGFADELIRVVKTMPKWNPATENGKIVRCYTYINYQFILPEDIRPQYGNPILETNRDRWRWENIEACHRKLLLNPFDEKTTLRMAEDYYWEYVFEHEPKEALSSWDSTRYKQEDWENYHDCTAVVSHPGDSALKYFYKVLEINPETEEILFFYLPVLQLEQQLHKEHNPLAKLPYDTVEGIHFPHTALINWLEDGQLDATKEYYSDAWSSFFWVDYFSDILTKMQEPIIFNATLKDDETVFRFTFFPSFHPPVTFRVMKNKRNVTLYWKILTEYHPIRWEENSTKVKEGHKKMTAAQYEQFLQYMEAVRLDERPNSYFWDMMRDGAQRVVERKTPQGYKAYFTNVAGQTIKNVFNFLTKLSGEKNLNYIEEYTF